MIALYGDENGFGWQLGEVVAAEVVTVPMSVPLDRAEPCSRFMMSLPAFHRRVDTH